MRVYRIFTASSLGLDEKCWDYLGEQGRESVDKQGCLGLDGTTLERGPIKVKDMILKEALEEKREETARAVRTFGDSTEAPSEV